MLCNEPIGRRIHRPRQPQLPTVLLSGQGHPLSIETAAPRDCPRSHVGLGRVGRRPRDPRRRRAARGGRGGAACQIPRGAVRPVPPPRAGQVEAARPESLGSRCQKRRRFDSSPGADAVTTHSSPGRYARARSVARRPLSRWLRAHQRRHRRAAVLGTERLPDYLAALVGAGVNESRRLSSVYKRRVLRLYPPLLLYVVLDLAVWAYSHRRVDSALVVAVLGYYSNYYQGLVPVGQPAFASHTWSLGVEEQFYVLWPLAVIAWRGNLRSLARFTAAAILGVWFYRAALHLGGVNEGYIYRAFDTRLDQLLMGCLAAVVIKGSMAPVWVGRLSSRPGTRDLVRPPVAVVDGPAAVGRELHLPASRCLDHRTTARCGSSDPGDCGLRPNAVVSPGESSAAVHRGDVCTRFISIIRSRCRLDTG